MRYVYIFIYLFIGLSGSMVQPMIVYGVNLFIMPGVQRVVYAKLSKSPCYKQLLFTAYYHE